MEAFKDSIVQLVGWDTCLPNEKDSLHLFIYDDQGSKSNPAFNKAIDDLISKNNNDVAGSGHPRLEETTTQNQKFLRVILNRTFLNAQPEFVPLLKAFTPNGIHNLGISSSLHEIGHALGLRHEDSHPADSCDIPNNEDDFKEPLSEDIAISSYNPFSFMSRCYYRSFNYDLGMVLPNKKDIEGLNVYYADLKPAQ